MKKFYLILLLCASCVIANAVPAYPGLVSFTQKDGTTISYYSHGDEYFSYLTTEDGYLIAFNSDGILEYAYFKDDCSLMTYGMKAHNLLDRPVNEQNFVASLPKAETLTSKFRAVRQQRMPQTANGVKMGTFPLSGSPRSLIILVSYSDISFSTPKVNFENLANQHNYSANGGTGSIQDYFIECSKGQFSPVFDVYGPYTLPQNRAYYGAQIGSDHDANPAQMIIDACLAADGDVNFADYDTDQNGYVDNIFVFYAGNNQADYSDLTDAVWPHRSSLAGRQGVPQLDGVNLADYACTSEYKGRASAMCGIGTFCHEFGHVLGLPDFYDTNYDKGLDAMSTWDIMTQGSRNNGECTPPTYTAYERFYLGWLTPTALVNDTSVDCEGSYTLPSLISSNKAFLISATQHNMSGLGPNPKEFFMLEHRKMEGRDSLTGLADGLLITHINYNSNTWYNNCPNNDATCLGYYPVLSNGKQAHGNKYDLYPYIADYCELTLHGAEEPMLRRVMNITDNDSVIAFDYASPNELIMLQVNDIDAYNTPTETKFIVIATGVREQLKAAIRDTREFMVRRHTAENSESYAQYVYLTPDTNGLIFDTIDVKYTPAKMTYDEYIENRFTVKGTETTSLSKFAKFYYRNRRPIFITEPVAYDPTDVSANSATLTWSFVADTTAGTPNIEKYGAKYYLDVYSITDEPQVETEGFEKFPQMNDDWSANFETSSTAVRKSGERSAVFTTENDTIYTKEFASDIESCSFWYSSLASEGTLYVDVYDYESDKWKNLKKISITANLTNDVKLTMKAGYRRMRFYYEPTEGQLAIDDISIQTSMSINYIAKNAYLNDTTYKVESLEREKEYRFKVRATDRDEKAAKARYENISGFSNEVLFKTIGDVPVPSGDEGISISVIQIAGTNYYVVSISELLGDEYKVFVYNLDGVLVDKLNAPTNVVELPQLPVGQYIVKYAKDDNKSKSGPTTKFYYTSYLK